MTQQIIEGTKPIQFLTLAEQARIPAPLIRIKTCGLLTIEIATEIVSLDPPQARYVSLTPDQLHGRGTGPALKLLKLLLNRHERFASREWLLEAFCRERELFASARIDNVVSQLRGLLCPPTSQELRTQLVTHVRSSSSDGYQLALYPLVWVDQDALVWNVEQAVRMERFNDDALPFWERAYELAQRGPYLPGERYVDWATFRREQVAGMLRQSVQALARLYQEQHGSSGEEEALVILRNYWLEHQREEDVLRALMELLGKRECTHEALAYYEQLCHLLQEDEREPDAQTQDIAQYLRNKQIQRRQISTAPHLLLEPADARLSPAGVDSEYIFPEQGADLYASVNNTTMNLISEAIQQGIIEAARMLENQWGEPLSLEEQGDHMAQFDAAKRATIRQLAILFGGMLSDAQARVSFEWLQKNLLQTSSSQQLDLDLAEQHIDALATLLARGEAYYAMQAAHQLYQRFNQEATPALDIRFADLHLRLGFLVAAAQEYALGWYQRDQMVVQTYDHMEQAILRKWNGNPHFQHAYARLLAKRGRQHRVLWLFDLCEKECEEGFTFTAASDDYSLRTHFLCEHAHIEATRGNELPWLNKLDVARTGVLSMPSQEREKALHQIDYMQGEGYKRFAFHSQKDFSLPQRERYAKLALNHLQQWNGSSIEAPGFESVVASVSRAQCLILLDPEQAMVLAEQQKMLAEQHYPTLLAKISRVLFFAQQRLHMDNDAFISLFQGSSQAAYQAGANIL